ncbi:MAG: hypothetical protein WC906_05290 [Parcubacteria group bacterium]
MSFGDSLKVFEKDIDQESKRLKEIKKQEDAEAAKKYSNNGADDELPTTETVTLKNRDFSEEEMELHNARNGIVGAAVMAEGSKEISDDFEKDYGKKKEKTEENDAEKIEKDLMEDLGGKKFGEKEKNLENLEKELETARKEYAEMYFKKKSMWKQVRNFFTSEGRAGRKADQWERNQEMEELKQYHTRELRKLENNLLIEGKNKKEVKAEIKKQQEKNAKELAIQSGRETINTKGVIITEGGNKAAVIDDQDVVYMEALYENSLIDYKTELLENIRAKGLSGDALNKELAEALKFFNFDETANLYDAKTEARTDLVAKENPVWDKINKKRAEVINWYIKLPTYQKILIAGGLGIGAASASYAGAAVAGSCLVLNMARRFLTGSASAIGAEAMSEKIAEKHREKKSGQEMDDIMKNMKEKTDDKKFEEFNSLLKDQIFKVNEKFEKRNIGSGFRKGGAIVFGALMAGPVMSKLFHLLSEKTGASDFVKEKAADVMKSDIVRDFMQKHGFERFTIVDNSALHSTATMPENPSASGVEHTIGKAGEILKVEGHESSLEKTLIDHLKESGMNAEEAGRKAHLMAEKYVESLENPNIQQGNLIHEGAGIQLDPSGEKIIGITDPNFGDLPEHHPSGASHIENPTEQNPEGRAPRSFAPPQEALDERTGASVQEPQFEEKTDVSDEYTQTVDEMHNRDVNRIGEIDNEIKELDQQPSSRIENYYWKQDLLKERGLLSNNIQDYSSYKEIAVDNWKNLTDGNKTEWDNLKGLKLKDALQAENIGDKTKLKLQDLQEYSENIKGGKIKRGETVAKWTLRLSKLIFESKK